ncbi:MAG: MFS transporter [Chloroflexota bacterium]|nr:MFS transporter [Chloroflexota bacterium]
MVSRRRSFLDRDLEHYPATSRRVWYLALAVAATVVLYYEAYVLPSVSPLVLANFHITFISYVLLNLASNLAGALSSLIGSFSDRIGRANLVVYGVIATSLVTLGIALTSATALFIVLIVILGFVEGIILVATPALVRDFSPRLGRATAMAFWTVGPVGGSLLITLVASLTLPVFGTWQSQYIIAGIFGLIISALCFLGLRDLSPSLRAQIMTSMREKMLLEARSRGIDVAAALKNPWRQMLRPRIILSALGISIFLLLYFAAVGYFPIYLSTIFKYSLALANGLLSIYWVMDVIGSIVTGIVSDKLDVRKPFMVFGAIANLLVILVFISRVGQPTDPVFMGILFAVLGFTGPIAYVGWMAGYTETVEDINPALVATGISVWGFLVRLVVVVQTLAFGLVVVDIHNPGQWATWWWVCVAGVIVFLPTAFLTSGYWSPAKARAAVQAKLQEEGLGVAVPVEPTPTA